MRGKILFFIAATALAALSLPGCGGDGSSSAPVTGVSRGAITSTANSITVNGVEFNTTGASIVMDDPTDSTTLKNGMVVTVQGQFTDAIRGTAFVVKMANNLKAPIAAFSTMSSSMTVLGQKVRFDPTSTVFDNFSGGNTSSTAKVAIGQMARISGFYDTKGTIHATFIQRKLPNWALGTPVTIMGTITSPPTATTFTIGALTVNFTGLALPAGTKVGSFVKVVGTIPAVASTTLTATSVQLPPVGLENDAPFGARTEAEGFVFDMVGNTFTVAGTKVNAGNLPLTGIANGSKVEVEGTMGTGGVIMATKIIADSQFYAQANLISNIPGVAARTDPNLINAWGIARSPASPWWVNTNGTGLTNIFFGRGAPFQIFSSVRITIPIPVTVPAQPAGTTATPTGIVFNNFSGFDVTAGVAATSARFVFVTEDGTVSAWNTGTAATLKVNNAAFPDGPVYKGATLATTGTRNLLYVANFRGGTVDVFDSAFAPVALGPGAFTVPAPHIAPPAGYAPFNIANIGGKLYVTYAMQNGTGHDDVAGQGHGFVEVFNPDGSFVMSLQNGLWLNSPWGVAMAPADFGNFGNMLLVGNFGSGQIAAYDPITGAFMGLLRDTFDDPIVIDGLWGIGFGNGGAAGPTNTLFFAAGLNAESDGLFGTLAPVPHVEATE